VDAARQPAAEPAQAAPGPRAARLERITPAPAPAPETGIQATIEKALRTAGLLR